MKKPILDNYDEEEDFIVKIREDKDMGALELSEFIEQLFEGKMNKVKKKQLNELIYKYNDIVGFRAYSILK